MEADDFRDYILGFIFYKYLSEMARRGNGDGKHKFILDDLTRVLNNIAQSTMGTDSEEDFDHIFEDLDLTSSKLGKTENAKNELVVKVLTHLDEINFKLEDTESDVLGDAYEYLIGKFASGAGKKAGEFYTPQQVSIILAKIVTSGKDKLKSVYDPTCGSGSLFLRVAGQCLLRHQYTHLYSGDEEAAGT